MHFLLRGGAVENGAMPRLSPDPANSDPPRQVCVRCSKPLTPGSAAQRAGRPVHMRCLARDIELQSIELQDRAGLEVRRAKAAQARAAELIDKVRQHQTICPACGERLAGNRGVLFQGDQLVHAGCWRADAEPFDSSPPVT
jgi:hypothetical protein